MSGRGQVLVAACGINIRPDLVSENLKTSRPVSNIVVKRSALYQLILRHRQAMEALKTSFDLHETLPRGAPLPIASSMLSTLSLRLSRTNSLPVVAHWSKLDSTFGDATRHFTSCGLSIVLSCTRSINGIVKSRSGPSMIWQSRV